MATVRDFVLASRPRTARSEATWPGAGPAPRARAAASRSRVIGVLLTLVGALAALALLPAGASAKGLQDARLRPTELDLKLERTRVIKDTDYGRMPPMGENGEMGVNLRGSSYFSVAHQQLGDLYIRSGITRSKRRRVEKGLSAFDYAFRFQRRDGSFPVRQVEEYAFFVQAVAHSVLLLRESKYAERYEDRLDGYVVRLEQAAKHMVTDELWKGFVERNQWYTHTGYTMGTALSLTGRLAHKRKLRRYGQKAIRLALARQRGDGINPELRGYDVRYQMVGISYAQRFRVYFPRHKLTPRVERMANRGIRWMRSRVDKDGWIDWRGSTRTCNENNTAGGSKSPGYQYAIRGFAYWGRLKGRRALVRRARQMYLYLEPHDGNGTLCGPKQPPSTSSSSGADRDRGRLSGARLNDLYE